MAELPPEFTPRSPNDDRDLFANRRPLFPLGQVFVTPGAVEASERTGDNLGIYVRRHHHGDWGKLDPEDKALNNRALRDGSRILSAYEMSDEQTKLWVITDAEVMEGVRLSTTVLLPDEY